MTKSVQLAAIGGRQVASPACTDYWAPMIGLVGQPAARRPQVALPWHLPMDWAFQMIGLTGQLAARWLQVVLPGRLPMDWQFHGHQTAIKVLTDSEQPTPCTPARCEQVWGCWAGDV